MKRSTALFKQANFTYSNLKKLKKSIRHSLQLIDKLHFNPELTDLSWLYSRSTKQQLLTTPETVREDIADTLISRIHTQLSAFKQQSHSTPDETERQKITKTISKRRTDLNNEMRKGTYTEKQRQAVAAFLELIKKPLKEQTESYFSTVIPEQTRKKILSSFSGTKAAKLLNKIIQLHNARIAKPVKKQTIYGRTVVMQESFFKIPVHNEVELAPDDYYDILRSFMTKYFPDHKIELAVFHGNEKAMGEPDYNAHCHIFINGQNTKTGEYDLLDRTRHIANQFAKRHNLPPIPNTLDGMRLVGEYRQKIFYAHANEYLRLKNRQVELYVLPETEARRKQRAVIRADANKPKELRFFNQINYQQQRLDQQNEMLRKLQAQNQSDTEQVKQMQKEVEQTRFDLAEAQNRLDRLLQGVIKIGSMVMAWARLIFKANPVPADKKRLEIIQILDQLKPDLSSHSVNFEYDEVRAMLDEANAFAEHVENIRELKAERKISPVIKRVKPPRV